MTLQGGGKTRYTLTLQPGATGLETWLRSSQADANKSALEYLQLSNNPTDICRGLLKFDLSAIPSGALIVSATLYLYAYQVKNHTITENLARILDANSAWTTAGATWNYAVDAATRWAGDAGGDGGADAGCSVSGTDYSSTSLGSFVHTSGDLVGTEYSCALTLSEFNLMLASNNGFTLTQADVDGITYCASRHATAGYRPKLVVVYDF